MQVKMVNGDFRIKFPLPGIHVKICLEIPFLMEIKPDACLTSVFLVPGNVRDEKAQIPCIDGFINACIGE